jgi:hypothetical protein
MDSPHDEYYINAMRAYRKSGQNSPFVRVATTSREKEAKRICERAITRSCHLVDYQDGQFEKIFRRPHSIVDTFNTFKEHDA